MVDLYDVGLMRKASISFFIHWHLQPIDFHPLLMSLLNITLNGLLHELCLSYINYNATKLSFETGLRSLLIPRSDANRQQETPFFFKYKQNLQQKHRHVFVYQVN